MKIFIDEPGDDGIPGAQRKVATAALMLGTCICVLDGSIVNVALPTIGRAMHVDAAATVWVANAYLLSVAALLITFAAAAGRFGFRLLYVSGMSVFTLASLGCALSHSLAELTVMRLVQGVGGGALLSIAPALYRTVYPSRLLGSAFGINALVVASATAAGPAIGGALLAVANWQWLFAINVPLGAIAVYLSRRALPSTAPRRAASGTSFDVAGAVLSAAMMAALILAADACAHLDTSAGQLHAVLYAIIAVASLLAFVWRQRRAARPLLPLAVFAPSRFTLALMTSLCSFVGQGITFIALPFLFQNALGYSPLQSALLFTPWPLAIVCAAPYAGRLADRYPPAVLSSIGLSILSLGIILLALLPAHAGAVDICWRAFVCGLGFGFFQSPNNREMLGNTTPALTGTASGLLATARTFGQSLGAACVGIVLSLCLSAKLASQTAAADASATRISLWIAALVTLVATGISVSRLGKPHAAPSRSGSVSRSGDS